MGSKAGTRDLHGVHVRRCTEAIDPMAGYAYRTIANPQGRCVEIATQHGALLFDRQLARQLAEAILEIAGPAQTLDSDLAQADQVEVVYDERGHVAGFKPYLARTGSAFTDAQAFVEKTRRDKGLPPSSLLALAVGEV